jgi:hypothetical protein
MAPKIQEKKWGKAMSGTLMFFSGTFGGVGFERSIGNFSGNLIRYGRGAENAHQAMYYYATGANGGGGTMTKAMAVEAVAFIKNGIREGGISKSYKGPKMPKLTEDYLDWKKSAAAMQFRNQPIMSLTGGTADAVTAITMPGAKGRMTITLDDKMQAIDPVTDRPTTGLVVDYALSSELGYNPSQPHRPIVTGMMAGWIATRSTAWLSFFKKLMLSSAIWPEQSSVSGSKMDSMTVLDGDIVSSDSGSSTVSYAAASAAAAVAAANSLEVSAKKISYEAQKLLRITQRAARAQTPTAKQAAQIAAMLREQLSGGGLTAKQMNEVIDAAISGQTVDFTDYD